MNKKEVAGLKQHMIDGQIDGSVYTGKCACLKGTIANVKHCAIEEIPTLIKASHEPAERWFMQFTEGMTPENSNAMKVTLDWVNEFELYANS